MTRLSARQRPAPDANADHDQAIEVSGLSKRYRDVDALVDASFTVNYGEVFGYLGRNGSGKTTTVRVLTTLTTPSAGAAQVAGNDVVTAPHAVRAAIGVTMQDAALDPQMTGREHLELVLALWGHTRSEARAQANELLTAFGLDQAASRLIGTYSGGMQRRLDLASALVNGPRVLFLDEPTTGLDAQSRRLVWSRVRELRDQGTAIFLTTQYLEEAEALADRLAILVNGRIVAEGAPDRLREEHGPTTLRIRLAAGQPAPPGFAPSSPDTWFEQPSPGTEDSLRALAQLRDAGVDLFAFQLNQPSLEDVFVALTGTTARASDR